MNNAEVLIKFKGDTTDVDKAMGNATTSLTKLTKAFTIGNLAAKGISKGIEVFSENLDGAISRVDTMNNFPKVMSNLGISAEESAEVIDDLGKKLQGLPTSLDSAATSIQRFTSKNGDVKESEKLFLAVNNAILAGGAPAQNQAAALEQISQAYAKGKPDMMEWRTLMTAMPAQLKQVATAMGYVDADALGQALRDGSLSMDNFMNTMVKMNTEGVNGFKSFDEQARNATGGIQTSITNMKTAFVRGIGNIIAQVDKALEPFGGLSGVISSLGKVGEQAFKGIGEVLKEVIPMFIEIGKQIMPIVIKVFNKLKTPLQKLAKSLLPALKQIFDALVPAISQLMDALMPLITKIINTIVPLLAPLTQYIVQFISTITTIAIPVIKVLTAVLSPIIDIISLIIQVILKLETKILKVKENLMNAILTIFNFFKTNWQGILLFIVNPFAGAFKLLYDNFGGFRNMVNGVINSVKGFFIGLWTSMKNGAVGAWNGVKSVFSTVANFFKNIFTNAWNAVKNVFSTGGKIFTGIKDGIVNAFKSIVNGLIGGINKVISIPFNELNKVLNKIRNVNILGKKPFKGMIGTISVPKIPKLATGTNEVPQDMLAMIHKGEAIVPKKFNPYSNMSSSMLGIIKNNKQNQVINVYASFKQDSLGQTVRDIKTFSGGARNDYNYGVGV